LNFCYFSNFDLKIKIQINLLEGKFLERRRFFDEPRFGRRGSVDFGRAAKTSFAIKN